MIVKFDYETFRSNPGKYQLVTSHEKPEPVEFVKFMKDGRLLCIHEDNASTWQTDGSFMNDRRPSAFNLQMLPLEPERDLLDELKHFVNSKTSEEWESEKFSILLNAAIEAFRAERSAQ